MEPRIHFIGLFLILTHIINIESHPRHESSDTHPGNNNKLLTDFSDDVQNYLMEFGYLPKSNVETGNLRDEGQLRDAIRSLQRYGNIPVTGRIDERTRLLLKAPRCGVPDFDTRDFKAPRSWHRAKRFVIQGQKWSNENVTWSLVNQTMTSIDAGQTRRILHEALSVWSKNSKLNFRETMSTEADIQVLFAKKHHGDGYDFDGPGNILAHAFYPGSGRGGDAHFDIDEDWQLDDRSIEHHGTSLKNVAVHEFGHSLGLGHSSVQGAVMFPWYHGYRGDGDLPEDDRLAIQEIYGARDGLRQWGPSSRHRYYTKKTTTTAVPTTRPTTRRYTTRRVYADRRDYERRRNSFDNNYPQKPRYYPSSVTTLPTTRRPSTRHHPNKDPKRPDTCNTAYDSITMIRGEIFIFKDRYLWRIGNEGRLLDGYPHEIVKMWSELPHSLTHIDSVYENKRRQIVFFIGKHYYVFHSHNLLPGYPKRLTDLGLPETVEKIDATLIWGHNNRTYFYSGTQYWRFDEDEMQVELDYPRDMSIWKHIGYHIDSAFQFKDGKTYFFKGKGYWQFDDMRMRAMHNDPKKSAIRWMGCRETLELDPRSEAKNPKRDEETEDVNDDEEDNYFEFEESTLKLASGQQLLSSYGLVTALLATILLRWGLN